MAAVESGSWHIHESRDGKGSLYEITSQGLTVGRHADADIIVHSRTVDQRHARIQWDSLNKCYAIRDLDTVNGTFVNKRLLRGECQLLKDGDSLRFGYDMQQIFRVKHIAPPLPVSQSMVVTATQTSSQQDVAPPAARLTEPHPHSHSQYVTAAQPTTMVAMPPVILPQMISYGVVPGTNQLVPVAGVPTPQLIPATPPHQLVSITPTIQSVQGTPTFQPIPAASTSQPVLDTPTVQPIWATPTGQGTGSSGSTGTVPTGTMPTGTVLTGTVPTSTMPTSTVPTSTEPTGKKERMRWDGRRPIPMENIPNLSHLSGLYGQPYWWGEEENANSSAVFSDSELDPRRRAGRILRDLDTYRSEDEGGRKRQVRRRVLQDMPLSNSSTENIQEEMEKSATSFTIAFEAPKRAKPTQLRGQRPVSSSGWRSKSLHLATRQSTPRSETMSTPPVALMTSQKPPSGAKRQSLRSKTQATEGSPLVRSQAHTSIPVLGQVTGSAGPASKELSLTNTLDSVSSNVKQEELPSDATIHTGQSPMETIASPMGAALNPTQINHPPLETALEFPQVQFPLQSVSESGLGAGRSVSQPTSRHRTPRGRPSSARKRWRDGLSEVPYGLMLAAIAARTKRVAETAQKTADVIHTLISSTQEAGLATSSTTSLSNSLSHTLSLKPPNFGLPQWAFVHKDFTEIFENLTSIEKSLKDMMAPLATTNEEVDYQSEEESNGEALAGCDYTEEQLAAEADDESEG